MSAELNRRNLTWQPASIGEDFGLLVQVTSERGEQPASLPVFQRMAVEVQAGLDEISNDHGTHSIVRLIRKQEFVETTRTKVNEVRDAYDRELAALEDAFFEELTTFTPPPDAASIRAQWADLDQVVVEDLYRKADPVHRAAIATAPQVVRKTPTGLARLEPIVSRAFVRQIALDEAPVDISSAVRRVQWLRSQNQFLAGSVVRLLSNKVPGTW